MHREGRGISGQTNISRILALFLRSLDSAALSYNFALVTFGLAIQMFLLGEACISEMMGRHRYRGAAPVFPRVVSKDATQI